MFSLFGKRKKDEAPQPSATASATVEPSQQPETPQTPAPATIPSPWASMDGATDAIESVENPGGLNLDALLAPPPAASQPSQPEIGPVDAARTDALKPKVVEALSTIYDPEIPVNIYELGLIYDVIVDGENRVGVRMTLTSPACPSAQQLPSEARYKVKAIEGVTDCAVDIVWEPPWTKDMMSESAKLSLGIF